MIKLGKKKITRDRKYINSHSYGMVQFTQYLHIHYVFKKNRVTYTEQVLFLCCKSENLNFREVKCSAPISQSRARTRTHIYLFLEQCSYKFFDRKTSLSQRHGSISVSQILHFYLKRMQLQIILDPASSNYRCTKVARLLRHQLYISHLI